MKTPTSHDGPPSRWTTVELLILITRLSTFGYRIETALIVAGHTFLNPEDLQYNSTCARHECDQHP